MHDDVMRSFVNAKTDIMPLLTDGTWLCKAL